MNKVPIARLAAGLWLISTANAFAGMTVIGLSDLAQARIDALSFFIGTYLLICWVVKLLWNHLSKTFTALPKLDYRRAFGLVFVTGLMFYVVLTMISGARELLTPGAWEKQGVGYRVREGEVAALGKDERRNRLRELQIAIWAYAKSHDGKAPSGPFADGIASPVWEFPGGGLMHGKTYHRLWLNGVLPCCRWSALPLRSCLPTASSAGGSQARISACHGAGDTPPQRHCCSC